MGQSGAPEPAGLYLHVPFCSAICPYCDFAVRRGGEASGTAFVEALVSEIEGVAAGERLPEAVDLAQALKRLVTSRFDSVYLGGGTPSLLAEADLERLLESVRRHFDLAPGTRFYLEANPEHVDEARAESWRRLGIGTLSLGVQAFDDDALRFLGRAHDTGQAVRAIRRARAAGFETLSVDLIYGLPGQTPAGWRRQLDLALSEPIDHLSLYELEIHRRTDFGKRAARGELSPLDQDTEAALFLETHGRLRDAGWRAYEVSNFARTAEHRSRHNRKYWRHTPYLGLGPSAHSFASDPDFGLWRFWNESLEPRWRRHVQGGGSAAAGWERLPASALALEIAMLGLRTEEGLDLDRFESAGGPGLVERNRDRFATWEKAGWVSLQGRSLRPTLEGMARADRLAADLELG